MLLKGREELLTSELEITYENVIDVIRRVIALHTSNANDIEYLNNFERGIQPLVREKKYRRDINLVCVDNVAAEVITFKTGYQWGNPFTLVQRGDKDNGGASENKAITMLNACFDAENLKKNMQQLARDVEIGGIGYTMLDVNTDYVEGDSYFTHNVLDPRNTFVIRSSRYPDKRVMLAGTFAKDTEGNRIFTVFTKDSRFEIINLHEIINGDKIVQEESWNHAVRSGEVNPLGIIPIVEWERSCDRTGAFERQIDNMNILNVLESDYANGVDQSIQCVWHSNDVEFPKDAEGRVIKPKSNEWVQTFTARDGKTPFITPLSVNYDFNGMLENIVTKRTLILQMCNVPQRNDNSGGSTGIAMSDATGWSQAEVEANKQEGILESCKLQEVKIALACVKLSPYVEVDNPMLNLRYSDCKVSIKRQKTYEMTTKANYMATLLSHGFYGEHVINSANAFDDPHQVWEDSKEMIMAYQNSIIGDRNDAEGGEGEQTPNHDRIMQDSSDQAENSPMM